MGIASYELCHKYTRMGIPSCHHTAFIVVLHTNNFWIVYQWGYFDSSVELT